MAGWNLPPGCSVRDIPGNRIEDEAWEKLCGELDELNLGLSDEKFETLAQWVSSKLDEANKWPHSE